MDGKKIKILEYSFFVQPPFSLILLSHSPSEPGKGFLILLPSLSCCPFVVSPLKKQCFGADNTCFGKSENPARFFAPRKNPFRGFSMAFVARFPSSLIGFLFSFSFFLFLFFIKQPHSSALCYPVCPPPPTPRSINPSSKYVLSRRPSL